jgi:hypothetical protein
MRKGLYILLILMATTTCVAQRTNWQQALMCYQEDSLDCAAMSIDLAILDSNENESSYTWHIRGFIYKAIFKKTRTESERSAARSQAIEAFAKSLELDTVGEFKENNTKAIESLGVSFYNDGIRHLNRFNVEAANQSLEKHNITMRRVDPSYFNEEREKAIKLKSAIIYMARYNDNRDENQQYFSLSVEIFNEVLEMDSNNFVANLNSGVLYHNLAVDLLLETKPELTILEVMQLQESHVNNMQRSLKYMKKAYSINPNHPGVIRALAGAYYSLHETEKYEFYNQKLLKLEGSDGNE